MSGRSTHHTTFVVERLYPVPEDRERGTHALLDNLAKEVQR